LDEIEIEEAVVVDVDERRAAAHDFGEVELVAMAGLVNELNAGARGDLLEPRRILRGGAGLRGDPSAGGREGGERARERPPSRRAAPARPGEAGAASRSPGRRLRRRSHACFKPGSSAFRWDA